MNDPSTEQFKAELGTLISKYDRQQRSERIKRGMALARKSGRQIYKNRKQNRPTALKEKEV